MPINIHELRRLLPSELSAPKIAIGENLYAGDFRTRDRALGDRGFGKLGGLTEGLSVFD